MATKKKAQKTTKAMTEAQRSLRDMMDTLRPFTEAQKPVHTKRPTRWVSGETSSLKTARCAHQR